MSKYYYFPPWRKQFFVSEYLFIHKKKYNFFFVYKPYKLILKLIWLLWVNVTFIRYFFKVDKNELPNTINNLIESLKLNSYALQINLGTNGREKKTTILAHSDKNQQLFIKIGDTDITTLLIKNEIKNLLLIQGKVFAPKIISYYSTTENTVMVTELINAEKMSSVILNHKIFDILINIANITDKVLREKDLIFIYTHGDFCPWNFLELDSGELLLIDWEHSGYYPLGYDLFTFIFQTNFLLYTNKRIENILDDNQFWIKKYFSYMKVDNYFPYLLEFTLIKLSIEKNKANSSLLKHYKSLLNKL